MLEAVSAPSVPCSEDIVRDVRFRAQVCQRQISLLAEAARQSRSSESSIGLRDRVTLDNAAQATAKCLEATLDAQVETYVRRRGQEQLDRHPTTRERAAATVNELRALEREGVLFGALPADAGQLRVDRIVLPDAAAGTLERDTEAEGPSLAAINRRLSGVVDYFIQRDPAAANALCTAVEAEIGACLCDIQGLLTQSMSEAGGDVSALRYIAHTAESLRRLHEMQLTEPARLDTGNARFGELAGMLAEHAEFSVIERLSTALARPAGATSRSTAPELSGIFLGSVPSTGEFLVSGRFLLRCPSRGFPQSRIVALDLHSAESTELPAPPVHGRPLEAICTAQNGAAAVRLLLAESAGPTVWDSSKRGNLWAGDPLLTPAVFNERLNRLARWHGSELAVYDLERRTFSGRERTLYRASLTDAVVLGAGFIPETDTLVLLADDGRLLAARATGTAVPEFALLAHIDGFTDASRFATAHWSQVRVQITAEGWNRRAVLVPRGPDGITDVFIADFDTDFEKPAVVSHLGRRSLPPGESIVQVGSTGRVVLCRSGDEFIVHKGIDLVASGVIRTPPGEKLLWATLLSDENAVLLLSSHPLVVGHSVVRRFDLKSVSA